MSFPIVSAPADFDDAGPLPDVAARFAAHIDTEQRTTWTAPASALHFGADGRLSAMHYPAAAFEEEGFRALLVYFNERFPRATPVLSRLSAPTVAAIWEELFDLSDPRGCKVRERRGAVYGVTPPNYATDYHVGDVMRDISGIFQHAPVPVVLTYTAAGCDARLVLHLDEFLVGVTTTDRYGEEVAAVRVYTLDGEDLGTPPASKRRRSSSNVAGAGLTIAQGIAERIAGAPAHFAKQRPG